MEAPSSRTSAVLAADAGRHLATAVCLASPARVREVVTLDEGVLVAVDAHAGRWFLPGSRRADDLGFADLDVATELLLAFELAWPIGRRLTLSRLARWRHDGTPLVAFRSVAHASVGLTDPVTGTSIIGPA